MKAAATKSQTRTTTPSRHSSNTRARRRSKNETAAHYQSKLRSGIEQLERKAVLCDSPDMRREISNIVALLSRYDDYRKDHRYGNLLLAHASELLQRPELAIAESIWSKDSRVPMLTKEAEHWREELEDITAGACAFAEVLFLICRWKAAISLKAANECADLNEKAQMESHATRMAAASTVFSLVHDVFWQPSVDFYSDGSNEDGLTPGAEHLVAQLVDAGSFAQLVESLKLSKELALPDTANAEKATATVREMLRGTLFFEDASPDPELKP